jgi:hypothetical protein
LVLALQGRGLGSCHIELKYPTTEVSMGAYVLYSSYRDQG